MEVNEKVGSKKIPIKRKYGNAYALKFEGAADTVFFFLSCQHSYHTLTFTLLN